MLSNQFDSDHGKMSAKLIRKNQIQIVNQKKSPAAVEKSLSKSLAKNLNSLSQHLKHSSCNLSNSLDRNLDSSLDSRLDNRLNHLDSHSSDYHSDYNSNYQLADNNRLKANHPHNASATMKIEQQPLCDEYPLNFNGKPNNGGDLDNTISKHPRNARQQTKSISFESSLTDDYNSEHSTEEIGGFLIANADSHSSNLEEEEDEEDGVSFDKPNAEMEELLDKRSIKDQKIVEVVSDRIRLIARRDLTMRFFLFF